MGLEKGVERPPGHSPFSQSTLSEHPLHQCGGPWGDKKECDTARAEEAHHPDEEQTPTEW